MTGGEIAPQSRSMVSYYDRQICGAENGVFRRGGKLDLPKGQGRPICHKGPEVGFARNGRVGYNIQDYIHNRRFLL